MPLQTEEILLLVVFAVRALAQECRFVANVHRLVWGLAWSNGGIPTAVSFLHVIILRSMIRPKIKRISIFGLLLLVGRRAFYLLPLLNKNPPYYR